MQHEIELTKQFHLKHGFDVNKDLSDYERNKETKILLDRIATMLLQFSKDLETILKLNVDPRIPRVQLMVEELSEVIEALVHCDKVALLDGLSDLMFVTIGTAIAFNMPLTEGLLEVCKSNLTKNVRQENNPRLRDKGPDYRAPDMKGILERHPNG